MGGNQTSDEGMLIGEVAAATGLTVRAVHYYEQVGLLTTGRTAAGHRTFDDRQVARLSRVRLLRSLGMALADIRHALDDPAWDLTRALEAHLAAADQQAAAVGALRRRLSDLLAAAGRAGASSSDDLLALVAGLPPASGISTKVSIVVCADVRALYATLQRVFQLVGVELEADATGVARHATLAAGDATIWLHPESPAFGLASPATVGAATATMAVMVADVDAHHAHAVREGADVLYAPVDQPYGYREYSARDAEGGLWSFMRSLEA